MTTGSADVRARVAAVWRIEAARVIAGLARVTGEVALAEDLAQDALVAALEQWPRDGIPDNPAAWLTAVARRRYVDAVRRVTAYEQKLAEIGRGLDVAEDPIAELDETADRGDVGDDKLGLVFAACHPALAAEARVALTLRMVGGLTTDQIANAFRVPVPTMAARITRAKKALGAARVPFEVPSGEDLTRRLESVLDVVYLIFNEGYAASSGAAWTNPVLCEESMRLARILAGLAPGVSEAHGLVALLELQASRLGARDGADGAPVQLLDQDRARWDRTLITHALAALDRAGERGTYVLQAEIAACHARAGRAADTDWPQIARLYGELVELTESPIVELNRAVAVAMAGDAVEALAIVDDLIAADLASLREYHLVPAVRGDVLLRLDRRDEAAVEFRRAAALCGNEAERAVLLTRAAT